MPYAHQLQIEAVETDAEARVLLPDNPLATAMYAAEREAGKPSKQALEEVLATWRAVWRCEVIDEQERLRAVMDMGLL